LALDRRGEGSGERRAGWPRQALEERALTDGYAGGFIATLIVLTDVVMRYLV
jgi:hypothetical protein